MIKVENLTKNYNGTIVLNIPSLEIKKGESIGLIGNNGAGKTTFFSLLLDLIQPSSGKIFTKEIPVNESEDWKTFTTSFLDESFLIGYLTPEEYFYFIGDLRKQSKTEVDAIVAKYQEFFNGEILNSKKYIRDFSKGNQKKIGIVGTLIGNPELIVLDEPFANLDPTSQFRLKKIFKELAEDSNITILVSSHDLQHTFEVSQRILALRKGELVRDMKTSETTMQELEQLFI